MKAIRTFKKQICAYAVVLLASVGLMSPVQAGSSDFAGINVAVMGSVVGASINGTHTGGNSTTGGATDEVTSGTVGGFVPLMGYEVGFNLPLGDVFFIGAGATYVYEGDAVLTEADSSDHATGENFTLEVSDHKTFWIQPSISIFDNSALYAKIGRSMADLNVIGAATGAPSNINGTSYAIGTQTISDMGFFIKTEAGATQYSNIGPIVGVGGNGSSVVEGDPITAFGSVTIGFNF